MYRRSGFALRLYIIFPTVSRKIKKSNAIVEVTASKYIKGEEHEYKLSSFKNSRAYRSFI